MLKRNLVATFAWIRRMLKPPRQLQFTRLGTYVVLLALGVGFAAMNTGNNLVYMVFGMMLGVITASGIISEMSLRGLEIDWILPGEITAKSSCSARIILINRKRKLPSIGINVMFKDPFEVNRAVEGTFPQEQSERSGTPRKHPSLTLKTFFLYIPAGERRSGDIALKPLRRGEYALPAIKVETQFPFGFFKKSLTVEPSEALLVYPEHVPVSPRLNAASNKRRDTPAPVRGWGDSFWGLRDFAQGDNPRRVAWKTSAKRGRWMVLETEQDRDRELLADLRPIADWRALSPDDLEAAVAFAATHLIKSFEKGMAVGLIADDFYSAPTTQRTDLARMLRYLALFNPSHHERHSHQISKVDARSEASRVEASQPVPPTQTVQKGVQLLSLWKTRGT